MFQMLRLNGHYTSAIEFQKRYPCTIVLSNHLVALQEFVQGNEHEPTIIIYCGHGSPGKWCVGIQKNKLHQLTKDIQDLTIVSDSCFSDSMNIRDHRHQCVFISAARATGSVDDTSAFFTFDGGYLSCTFYKEYQPGMTISQLKERILQHYFDDKGSNLHRPAFFIEE